MRLRTRLYCPLILMLCSATVSCTTSSGANRAIVDVAEGATQIGNNELQNQYCAGSFSNSYTTTALCRGIDLALQMTQANSNNSELYYRRDDQFDKELHLSMKSKLPRIDIDINNTRIEYRTITSIPKRPNVNHEHIVHWLAKILRSGGVVLVCESRTDESFTSALAALLLDIAVNYTKEFLTYRPAKNYNAIFMVTYQGSNTFNVEKLYFLLKSSTDNSGECPGAANELHKYALK